MGQGAPEDSFAKEFIPLMFRLYGGRLNLENRMDACDETRKGQNVE